MLLHVKKRQDPGPPKIEGFVGKGFEAVRTAFSENFSRRQELGAACCIYQDGEKVVDLWGGIRNKATGEPWEEDTMVLVHSATKGLAAMTLAMAHSRAGWTTTREWRSTGPSSPRTASKTSRFASCSRIRPACLRSTNRWIGARWRTPTGWRR